MDEKKAGVLRLQDIFRTVLTTDEIDAVRKDNRPRRVYIIIGNTSHVFNYEDDSVAQADYQRVCDTFGEDAIDMGDDMPSVVNGSALLGVRDQHREGELLVMLPSWTLICKYSNGEDRLKKYDTLVQALTS